MIIKTRFFSFRLSPSHFYLIDWPEGGHKSGGAIYHIMLAKENDFSRS